MDEGLAWLWASTFVGDAKILFVMEAETTMHLIRLQYVRKVGDPASKNRLGKCDNVLPILSMSF